MGSRSAGGWPAVLPWLWAFLVLASFAVQASAAEVIKSPHDPRSYETLVLGKAREEDVLRDTIASDLVRIVLIQLSSLTRNGV